jgi:hypothetical protein
MPIDATKLPRRLQVPSDPKAVLAHKQFPGFLSSSNFKPLVRPEAQQTKSPYKQALIVIHTCCFVTAQDVSRALLYSAEAQLSDQLT